MSVASTALHRNPFWLLGATLRDESRRIVELAEEKSLELDHEVCQKARTDLTNPRTRLAAELSWLPGVSPRRAAQLADQVLKNPMSIRKETGIPNIAHANLMAAAFEALHGDEPAEDLAEFIEEFAFLSEDLSAEEALRDLNEDRGVARFPPVKAAEQIEAELAERRRYYRDAMREALDRLPPGDLVSVMTLVVAHLTDEGTDHAPQLLDELVDSYQLEAQSFLDREGENARKLIRAIDDHAKLGEPVIKPLVDKLELVARNWDRVAQPIQLSAKARGKDHEQSNELAYAIRRVAIDLFNEHDMLDQAKRITALLQELFAEVPGVLERVEQDAVALEDILEGRQKAAEDREAWAREITYRAEIGMVFKTALSISPNGVAKDDQRYSLDSITRVRWGGLRRSINGIPTGTTFTIAFGDSQSEAVVELTNKEVFSTFVEKLWRAVAFRLITRILEALQAGKNVRFGGAVVRDDGLSLTKHKMFGADEAVFCTWGQVHIWTADGAFYVGSTTDKKTYAEFSYIETPNAHLFEQIVRSAFKKPGLRKLSELLQ